MRDIKFRAWDGERMLPWERVKKTMWPCDLEGHLFEIMQYTGLKDSSNPPKEIYEGDIFTMLGETYKVDWRSGCFMADNILNGKDNSAGFEIWDTKVFHELFDWRHMIKVIGNRFEHPELLEES